MEEEALIPWRDPQHAHCGQTTQSKKEQQKYRRHIYQKFHKKQETLTEDTCRGRREQIRSYHEEPFLCTQPYTQLDISCSTTFNQPRDTQQRFTSWTAEDSPGCCSGSRNDCKLSSGSTGRTGNTWSVLPVNREQCWTKLVQLSEVMVK